uniref:Uncharacterized protein n=1 Tax=Anguilla anguilla TaxID=7936 RepID=A0A0E9V612_ANGAN
MQQQSCHDNVLQSIMSTFYVSFCVSD